VKIGDRPAAVIGDEIRTRPLFRLRNGKARKLGGSESQKTCLIEKVLASRRQAGPLLILRIKRGYPGLIVHQSGIFFATEI
jgi:hypothetical protein